MTNDELIEKNMKLAYSIAWKYYRIFNGKIEYEDLKSVALIGLVKAARSYDPSRGFEFSTYAYNSIKNSIINEYKANLIQRDVSLSKPIGSEIELQDVLFDEENHIEDVNREVDYEILYKYIDELDEYSKDIILSTMKGTRRRELAEKYDKTVNQIGNDYYKAINMLRRKFKYYDKF